MASGNMVALKCNRFIHEPAVDNTYMLCM